MAFDNVDMEDLETPETEETPPEGGSNRTFMIVVGVIGAIMILTLICIAVFGAVYLPRQQKLMNEAATEESAKQTAMAISVMETDAGIKLPPTFTPTSVPPTATATKPPTSTQVVAKAATATSTGEADSKTATVAALLTQAAAAQQTVVPTLEMPKGGFADDVGLPGMLALAGSLVVIILLVRRLRSPS